MALSEKEVDLLLQFQRAKFEFDVRCSECVQTDKSRAAYEASKEGLNTITDPKVAELVRKMNQEWLTVVTPTSVSTDVARGEEIMFAEKELYELTYEYGDTSPNASAWKH
jgi:hypothetical protein